MIKASFSHETFRIESLAFELVSKYINLMNGSLDLFERSTDFSSSFRR